MVDIITPIHRDFYTEDPNGRITGPRYYFDDYDVEIGLYQPAVTELKSLQWYEAEHIQKNSEKDCLLVTSEYCDGELQWYITDEWVVRDSDLTPVDLQGYDFEQTFSEQILDGGNHFLVCGRNEEEQGIFWVEEWYIAAPIYGKTKKGDWDAYNYYRNQRFTLEDVEAGYYVPNSYDIFYKKYKDGIGTNEDVTYPWIKGLEDEELEQKVNALLYETAVSSPVFEDGDYQQDITYEVMRADEDVLSVVYHEFTINNPTMYVYYDNYAVTIDMHTGERMEIWDFIGMEEFDKQLLEGKFKSDFSDADELEYEWVLAAYRYDLRVPLHAAESEDYKKETEHANDFFVKDDGLGIIVEVGKYSVIFEVDNYGRTNL